MPAPLRITGCAWSGPEKRLHEQSAGFIVSQKICCLKSFDSLVGEFFSGVWILFSELVDHFRQRGWKLALLHHLLRVLGREFWIESSDAAE